MKGSCILLQNFEKPRAIMLSQTLKRFHYVIFTECVENIIKLFVTYFLYIFFYSKRFYLFLSVISDSRWKLYDRGNCYKSSADTAGLMTPGTADQRTGNENEARRILWRGWKIEQLQMHLQLVKKKNNDAFFEILDTRHGI